MKLLILIAYFIVLITIGFVCRQKATDVNGFVLGGRSVGPWLTAFAYGTSYFSAVVFVGYAGQFGWRFGIAATWAGIGNALIGLSLIHIYGSPCQDQNLHIFRNRKALTLHTLPLVWQLLPDNEDLS